MTEADDAKERSRGISTDMSSEAIMRRLQKVADLYEVWRWLRTAKRIGAVEQVRKPGDPGAGLGGGATRTDEPPNR